MNHSLILLASNYSCDVKCEKSQNSDRKSKDEKEGGLKHPFFVIILLTRFKKFLPLILEIVDVERSLNAPPRVFS